MSVAQLRDWRLPGCGPACYPRNHDPETHEQFGAEQARALPAVSVVRTGPLVVDLDNQRVTVNGAEVSLINGNWFREQRRWRLLAALAKRQGRSVSAEELVSEVIDGSHGAARWHENAHNLNVVRYRLRLALGEAARLVVNTRSGDMRLLMETPL